MVVFVFLIEFPKVVVDFLSLAVKQISFYSVLLVHPCLFRNLRALGCSILNAAWALLRARRLLNRPLVEVSNLFRL